MIYRFPICRAATVGAANEKWMSCFHSITNASFDRWKMKDGIEMSNNKINVNSIWNCLRDKWTDNRTNRNGNTLVHSFRFIVYAYTAYALCTHMMWNRKLDYIIPFQLQLNPYIWYGEHFFKYISHAIDCRIKNTLSLMNIRSLRHHSFVDLKCWSLFSVIFASHLNFRWIAKNLSGELNSFDVQFVFHYKWTFQYDVS